MSTFGYLPAEPLFDTTPFSSKGYKNSVCRQYWMSPQGSAFPGSACHCFGPYKEDGRVVGKDSTLSLTLPAPGQGSEYADQLYVLLCASDNAVVNEMRKSVPKWHAPTKEVLVEGVPVGYRIRVSCPEDAEVIDMGELSYNQYVDIKPDQKTAQKTDYMTHFTANDAAIESFNARLKSGQVSMCVRVYAWSRDGKMAGIKISLQKLILWPASAFSKQVFEAVTFTKGSGDQAVGVTSDAILALIQAYEEGADPFHVDEDALPLTSSLPRGPMNPVIQLVDTANQAYCGAGEDDDEPSDMLPIVQKMCERAEIMGCPLIKDANVTYALKTIKILPSVQKSYGFALINSPFTIFKNEVGGQYNNTAESYVLKIAVKDSEDDPATAAIEAVGTASVSMFLQLMRHPFANCQADDAKNRLQTVIDMLQYAEEQVLIDARAQKEKNPDAELPNKWSAVAKVPVNAEQLPSSFADETVGLTMKDLLEKMPWSPTNTKKPATANAEDFWKWNRCMTEVLHALSASDARSVVSEGQTAISEDDDTKRRFVVATVEHNANKLRCLHISDPNGISDQSFGEIALDNAVKTPYVGHLVLAAGCTLQLGDLEYTKVSKKVRRDPGKAQTPSDYFGQPAPNAKPKHFRPTLYAIGATIMQSMGSGGTTKKAKMTFGSLDGL